MRFNSYLLFLLLLSLPIVALAAPPKPAPEVIDFSQRLEGERARTLEDMSDAEALQLRPMLQRIRMALLTQQATLKDLEKRRALATLPEIRSQLDREVAQIKLGTERRMLEIQLEFARLEGRQATAESLEKALNTFNEEPLPVYQDRVDPGDRR